MTETTFGNPSILLGVLTRGIAEYKNINVAIRWSIWRALRSCFSEKYKVLGVLIVQGTTGGADAFESELTDATRCALRQRASMCCHHQAA